MNSVSDEHLLALGYDPQDLSVPPAATGGAAAATQSFLQALRKYGGGAPRVDVIYVGGDSDDDVMFDDPEPDEPEPEPVLVIEDRDRDGMMGSLEAAIQADDQYAGLSLAVTTE